MLTYLRRLTQALIYLLLGLVIFTAPINLFYKLNLNNAYVRGFFIDYLVPKIYLHDIFILGFILVGGIYLVVNNNLKFKIKNLKLNIQHLVPLHLVYAFLALLSVLFIIRQFFTPNPTASIYWLVKLVEVGLFGFILKLIIKNVKLKIENKLKTTIIISLVLTIIFQAALAIYQFHFQKNLLPYKLLGETRLSSPTGLAKVNLCGREKVLAYGTTAHPNILAGVVVIYTLLALALSQKSKRSSLVWLLLIPAGLTLALTLSFSAFLSLVFGVFGLLAIRYKPKLIKPFFILAIGLFLVMPLLIHLANNHYPDILSLSRRDQLNQAAIKMWWHYPFLGIGLNNFTTQVENFSNLNELVRFPQPVHHVGLLFLAENGILGVVMVTTLVFINQFKIKNLKLKMNKDRRVDHVFSIFNYPSVSAKAKQLRAGKIQNNNLESKIYNLELLIISLIPIAALDHWLISQSVGLIIMVLLLTLSEKSLTSNYLTTHQP